LKEGTAIKTKNPAVSSTSLDSVGFFYAWWDQVGKRGVADPCQLINGLC
jgi:hypothetical protein